jgi:hypothetical protein
MSESPRFDQSRKEWANSADSLADKCYEEFFGVTQDDIYDLESLVDDVHDREEGYKTHQVFDYGGLDRIIDCGVRHVYISQRFRPTHRKHTDLSLRTENGVEGRYPELTKWLTAYEEFGEYPSVLAFGLYDGTLGVIKEFYLLRMEQILCGISTGELEGDEHPTGDGTAALYVSVEDLRDVVL